MTINRDRRAQQSQSDLLFKLGERPHDQDAGNCPHDAIHIDSRLSWYHGVLFFKPTFATTTWSIAGQPSILSEQSKDSHT
jgi:hypothetical protein